MRNVTTTWLAMLALLVLSESVPAQDRGYMDSICRISNSEGAMGSGCVFERSNQSVWILTNAHVVGRDARVQCEFWLHGHNSQPLTGRVLLTNQREDIALLWLPESDFGGLPPEAIPLAPPDYAVRPGQTLVSIGCAQGAWPTAWKGHAIEQTATELRFVPPPANGRSGSAVFDEDGKQILALVCARDEQRAEGIAIPVQVIYRTVGQPNTEKTQACPGGTCPPYRLLPYRQQQEQGRGPSPVWPTLPGPAPNSVDLSETNRKLDEISKLLQEAFVEKRGAAAPPVPQPEAVEQAGKAAEEKVGRLQEGLGGLSDVVRKLAGDVETLPDRFETRLEKVRSEGAETAGQVARSYARDFLSEKLSDGTVGLTAGKILGGALGLSGPLALGVTAGLWLVSRRMGRKIRSGEPLAVQQLASLLGGKLDDLRDRIQKRSEGQS